MLSSWYNNLSIAQSEESVEAQSIESYLIVQYGCSCVTLQSIIFCCVIIGIPFEKTFIDRNQMKIITIIQRSMRSSSNIDDDFYFSIQESSEAVQFC
jgi:hypothetical protein